MYNIYNNRPTKSTKLNMPPTKLHTHTHTRTHTHLHTRKHTHIPRNTHTHTHTCTCTQTFQPTDQGYKAKKHPASKVASTNAENSALQRIPIANGAKWLEFENFLPANARLKHMCQALCVCEYVICM